MASGQEFGLSRCLSDDEIGSLAEPVRRKLDAFVRDAKGDVEKLRVISEQKCFELQQQLQESSRQLESAQKASTEHAAARTALEEKLKSCAATTEEIKQTSSDSQKLLVQVQSQNEVLSTEKKDLLAVLEKRSREIEAQKEECKWTTSQLVTLTAEKFKALARVDELTSEDSILRQQLSRLEQEKDSLVKQVGIMNTEVSQTRQRLYSTRSEQSHKLIELQANLDDVAVQLRQTISVKESFQKLIEEQNQKLEKQSNHLKELREQNIHSEEQWQYQLQMQEKLADLYKASAEDGKDRVKELTTAVEEMQSLLRLADAEIKDHGRELDEQRQAGLEVVAEKEEVILKLKTDLDRAQTLLEQTRKQMLSEEEISGLSPSAAAASRLLKSGKSLAEIYTEYMAVVEQSQALKDENGKLNMYFDQVLKEIQSNAPTLMNQRQDYEKALKTITLLSSKLNAAVLEHDNMQADLSDTQRKYGALRKKEEELENTVSDLGQQVCGLLREIESLKGHKVVEIEDSTIVSSSSCTTASGAITANLVNFKDIQELQAQNQRLLAVVRDLGEKHERETQATDDQRNLEMRKELNNALDELEQMRTARERQKEAVEAVIQQRDMYIVLLNQANQNILNDTAPLSASTPVSAAKASISPQTVPLDEHDALRTSFQQFQEELSHFKTESSKNVQLLNEELEKLKTERVELRLYAAKLSAKLEFANERCQTARSNLESSKKEIAAIVARNQQLSELVGRHEGSVSVLRTELMSNHEKVSNLEVTLENLKLEHSLIKEADIRLKTENEILKREQVSQGIMMANLKAIENNLEKTDVEMKMQAHTRISLLEKELVTSREKLEREVDRGQTCIHALEKEKREILEKYQAEVESHHKTKDELVNSYGILHTARQEAQATEEKLKAQISRDSEVSRNRPVKLARPGVSQGDKDEDELSLLLAEAQSEVKGLKTQLEQAQQHLDQFKSMASSLQDQLKAQNETVTKLKENCDKLVKDKQEEITNLTQEVERITNENLSLATTNAKKTAHDETQVEELLKELASLREKLTVACQEAEESKHNEALARKDLQEQSDAVKEAKDNYQRELMLHASDIQALEKLQIEVSGYESKITAAKELTRKAEFALRNGQESWKNREILLKNQIAVLIPKCEELEKQNHLLHDQMEKMSDQMVAVQSKSSPEDKANVSSEMEESAPNHHLLELIKYLRKEREIATTKCEVNAAECQRLGSKVDFLQARLDDANRSLTEVQQKDEAGLATSAQHADLLRKVELLNVLTDGNRILREEKTNLQNQLMAAEEKMGKCMSEIAPLKEQNQDLAARCEALQADRRALEGEAKRWQMRTQQLTGMRTEKETVQSQLKLAQDETARLMQELAAKQTTLDEVNRTICQVRKIGRKYRTQFEECKTEYDELVVKHQDLEASKVAAEKAAAEAAAITGPNVAKAVNAAKLEVRQEMEVKVKELEDALKASDDRLKKFKQGALQRLKNLSGTSDEKSKEIESLNQKITALEQAQSALEEARLAARTSAQEKSALQREIAALTQKMSNQQKHIDTLQARLKENTNIKLAAVASSSRESSILSQSGLEGTPPTANIKPMATMPGSSTVRHAHPVNQQSRQTPMGRIRPITPFPQSTRMAAVTPTTASPALSQQQQQQQQQQQHDSSDESSLTVMTASTSAVSCVPQAAVAPTPAVHAVTALNSTATAVSSSSLEGSSPQHHHPVAAFTETTPNTVEETDDVDVTSNDAPQDLSVAGSSSMDEVSEAFQPKVVVKRLRIESDTDDDSDKAANKKAKSEVDVGASSSSSTSNVLVCPPATEASPPTLTDDAVPPIIVSEFVQSASSPQVAGAKLASEDPDLEIIIVESDEDDEEDKRSKNDANDEVDEEEAVEDDDVNVYDEEDQVIVGGDLSNEAVAYEADDDGGADEEEAVQQMEGQDATAAVEDFDDEDDQMTEEFVESEDEGDKMDDEQFQNVAEEMVDDDVEIIEHEDISENVVVEEEEEEALETNAEVDESQALQPMDDRTTSGDAEAPLATVEPMEQQPQPVIIQPLGIPIQRQLPQMAARMTAQRLPTLNRGQQPAPFPTMGANTSGGFDDGDSIVPSTPTLFDPRKNDGFAEAVSSPQVPPERFLFSSSVSETPSQLASQGALGVDDTRMDLSQLDESSGRSVPSTPLQVSPPETLQEASAFAAVADDTAVPSITIQDVTNATGDSSEAVGLSERGASVSGDASPVVVIVEEPAEAHTEQRTAAVSVVGPSIVEVVSQSEPLSVGSEPSSSTTATPAAAAASAASPISPPESRVAPSVQSSSRQPPPRPFPNNRGSATQRGGYDNQSRRPPIVWDRPHMSPEGGTPRAGSHVYLMQFGRGGNPGGQGQRGPGGGGQNRMYRHRGGQLSMRSNRPYNRGGGGGRGHRFPRAN